MKRTKRALVFTLIFGILSSACSLNGKDEGFFSKMGRFIASADTIESEMAAVRSIVQELNTNGNKVFDLYAYPTAFKVTTFKDNTRIVLVLSKLKSIQKQLLADTSKVDPLTKEGQKLLLLTADYLQALVTVNKLFAMVAHSKNINGGWNVPSNYDWKQLDPYNLLLDKRYALILLSKINFVASHMSDTEVTALGLDPKKIKSAVEINLGGESRQMLEHLAINNPSTPTDYARLLKYNAVRETLINTWGINRVHSQPNEPVVNEYQAKGILTFRPGSDGKYTSGEYYKELMQSDKYYNIYTPILREVVMATISTKSKRLTIGNAEEYAEIYRTLIYGYPEVGEKKTIQPFAPVSDYFLGKGKYEGDVPWTKKSIAQMYTGEEIMTVEEADWLNEKSVNLFYTAFVGDKLEPKELTRKMVEYAWLTRSTAVVTQVRYRIQNADMTEDENKKLTDKIWLIVGQWKDRYVTSLTATLEPILTKYLNEDAVKKIKIISKYAGLFEVVDKTEAARAAYVQSYLKSKNEIPALRMLPRTPESLIAFVQYSLGKGGYEGLVFALEGNPEITKVVKDFYTELSNSFYKRAKAEDSLDTLTQIMWEEAHNLAFKYYHRYPYTSQQRLNQSNADYMESHPTNPVDNNYVYRNPYININFKTKVMPTPNPIATPANKTAKHIKVEPLNFDQKLMMMMQTFQPYMQGQDYSAASSQAKNETHDNFINIDYEKWKTKKTYQNVNRVLWDIFSLMGLNVFDLETKGTFHKYQQFAKQIAAQEFYASQAIAMAYQAGPLLRNEIFFRTVEKTVHEGGDGLGDHERTYTIKIDEYLPALEVMGQTAYNPTTGILDKNKIITQISSAITSAMKSLKGHANGKIPATPFKEGLLETFAKTDPNDYAEDKRFHFMYDKLEQLRQIIMSGAGQPQSVSSKMEKLDFELFKKIHPWKYRYEKYIEPIANMMIISFMVISFIVGIVFPPAAMPGWLAMSLFVFEVSAFSFTMASNVGYRIIYQRMYEIPANLKMQTHLATIQSGAESPLKMLYASASGIKSFGMNTPLDSWDRVKEAEKENIDERRSMILERLYWLPLDMMWGVSILKMGKNVVGLSTVKSLKKLGLPVLTFNDKVKVVFKSDTWKKYIEENGLLRGVKKVTKDIVSGLPEAGKLLPKYQPYSRELLEKHGIRIGLFNKIESFQFIGNKLVVGTAENAIKSESLVLSGLFKEFRQYNEKEFKAFIEFQETHNTTNIMKKIQSMLLQGITPAEIISKPLGTIPKTFLGMLFQGVTESRRLKILSSQLQENKNLADAIEKFRDAKAMGSKKALENVLDEFFKPTDDEALIKALNEATEKTTLKSAWAKMQSNYHEWKLTKSDEFILANLIMQLDQAFTGAKHVRASNLVEKCAQVEKLAAKNPEFYTEFGFKSVTDYWLSLLDHSDIMLLEEIAKKAPRGSMVKNLNSVYKDYKILMETIRPLKWKKAAETYTPNEDMGNASYANDYANTVMDDANIYPNDGFGDKETDAMMDLEQQIENAL